MTLYIRRYIFYTIEDKQKRYFIYFIISSEIIFNAYVHFKYKSVNPGKVSGGGGSNPSYFPSLL